MEDWISLSSDYHNLILKDTLYREQVESVWKWVILICVISKAIPDLPSTIFFSTLAAFDYFFSYISLIIHPPAILPVLKIERKHTENGSFDSEGSWWGCQGDVEGPFESWLFLPLFRPE